MDDIFPPKEEKVSTSVHLPAGLVRRIDAIAEARKISRSKAVFYLLQSAVEAVERAADKPAPKPTKPRKP